MELKTCAAKSINQLNRTYRWTNFRCSQFLFHDDRLKEPSVPKNPSSVEEATLTLRIE
jgi:hypothetical protein